MRRVIPPTILVVALLWAQGHTMPATPTTPAKLISISGVAQINGKPLSGALVAAFEDHHRAGPFMKPLILRRSGEISADRIGEYEAPVSSVTTGDDGRWEMFVPPGDYVVAVNAVRHAHLFQWSRRATVGAEAQVLVGPLSNYGTFRLEQPAYAAVFYATDRQQGDPDHIFANTYGDGSLKYGICRVALGESDTIHCKALTHAELIEALRAALSHSTFGKTVIWIHGYFTDFRDAIRAGANITSSLRTPVLTYDWTSAKNLAEYAKDEDGVFRARANAKQLIDSIYEQIGGEHIALLSHSLGARLADQLLDHLADANRPLVSAAFAAADIDRDTIRSDMRNMRQAAHHLTSYASGHDLALVASEKFHFGNSRLGETRPPPIFVAEGLVSIDASVARTDWLGHGYYQDPRLLTDIGAALAGEPPNGRRTLRPNAGGWWEFTP